MDQAQVVRVCPRLDKVPIVIHRIITPVYVVAVEVADHHPSIIVDMLLGLKHTVGPSPRRDSDSLPKSWW